MEEFNEKRLLVVFYGCSVWICFVFVKWDFIEFELLLLFNI